MKKDELFDDILSIMRGEDYSPLTIQQLCDKLKLPRKRLPRVRKAVEALVRHGDIAKVKGDRFGLPADLDLISGIIDFRQTGWAFLTPSDGSSSLEIRPEDTGVALNGDKVLARVLAPSPARDKNKKYRRKNSYDKKKEYVEQYQPKRRAKVIRILERGNSKVIGTLRRSYNFWHVVPDNPRFYYDVIVADPAHSGVFPRPSENDKVVVSLNEWTQRHMNPTGTITENLGVSHTPMAEYKAILSKYRLNPEFPPSVDAEANRLPDSVQKRDIIGRKDLRGEFIFTIDPEDAKDFDDAVSIRRLGESEWEVGVHIADVSYYVRGGGILDKEAMRRGNSTYLVGTVIPMLPFKLSNGLCSLVENEDRLVKSVFLTIDADGICKGAHFANSVMRSAKRLSYEQAYALLKEEDLDRIKAVKPPAEYDTKYTGKPLDSLSDSELLHLRDSVREMWKVASALRRRRMKNGSLDLDIPEIKILCDKDGYADRVEKVASDESHQLIEEFMLAANESVAKELFGARIPFISRVHDTPDIEKLNELREELDSFGITCGDLSSRKEIMRVLQAINQHPQSYLLKTKFLRSMKRAEYRAEADGHFGLNKQYYAHFTSPIRRYADLVTHRCLDFLMQKRGIESARRLPVQIPTLSAMAGAAAHVSETEMNSTEAERDSKKVKLLEYFERAIESGETFEGFITAVANHGFFVELTESMASGFVHSHDLRDDFYKLSADTRKFVGRRTGKTYAVGDKIRVRIESVDRFKRQIDFSVAEH